MEYKSSVKCSAAAAPVVCRARPSETTDPSDGITQVAACHKATMKKTTQKQPAIISSISHAFYFRILIGLGKLLHLWSAPSPPASLRPVCSTPSSSGTGLRGAAAFFGPLTLNSRKASAPTLFFAPCAHVTSSVYECVPEVLAIAIHTLSPAVPDHFQTGGPFVVILAPRGVGVGQFPPSNWVDVTPPIKPVVVSV